MNVPFLSATALTGVPVIETPRLRLRAPGLQDADAYIAAHDDERARWMGGNQGRESAWRTFATVLGHWALRGFGLWAVTEKGSDACLGTVGCWYPQGWPEREIGWFVFPAAEGRGIAREAALAAREYAYRTLGWTTAVSYVHPDNARSIALAGRLGAVRDDGAPRPKPELGTLVFRHPGPEGNS
jgi:RimJ/RimL family protein N-acetyltransferase